MRSIGTRSSPGTPGLIGQLRFKDRRLYGRFHGSRRAAGSGASSLMAREIRAGIRSINVKNRQATVDKGKIKSYRLNAKITFTL